MDCTPSASLPQGLPRRSEKRCSPPPRSAIAIEFCMRGGASDFPPTPTTVIETQTAALEINSNGGGYAHDGGTCRGSGLRICAAAVDPVACEATAVAATEEAAVADKAATATATRAGAAFVERDALRCAETNARSAADCARVARAAARVMLSHGGNVHASLRAAAAGEAVVSAQEREQHHHQDRLVRRCGTASALTRLLLSEREPKWCNVGAGIVELASAEYVAARRI